ncbi:MAG: HNH endonuclease [Selenomonadaceae bacterium]|nr:HNH endonuclease [Selenomonadaceae bacterium]
MGNYREEWFKHNPSDHGWYTCARCGQKFRKADMDVDHIIPQKYGGSDALFNLQGLCKHCNRSKQADLSDTVPDLAKTNAKRVVKSVKFGAKLAVQTVIKKVKPAKSSTKSATTSTKPAAKSSAKSATTSSKPASKSSTKSATTSSKSAPKSSTKTATTSSKSAAKSSTKRK